MVGRDHESSPPAETVSRCYPKHVKPLRKLKSFRGNYKGHGKPGQMVMSKLHTIRGRAIEKIFYFGQF